MLDDDRRLVYAYDELQNLSGEGLPAAEDNFGLDDSGRPNVTFADASDELGARHDIGLEKCYRNSRPVLVSAHGLGFGIYREPSRSDTIGLVQMFDQPDLWRDIGYEVVDGQLQPGSRVTLQRTEQSSPLFLEHHSRVEDLIEFHTFASQDEQNMWVADQIDKNLSEDEPRHDDIMVINTDPLRTPKNVGPIRKLLLDRGIPNHLAGVDTVTDVFFSSDQRSVTFTGIYRAKGNEAGMVYIVNADECQSSSVNLARVRNRLFTAMTRSRAWVRVVGVGPRMAELVAAYTQISATNYALSFRYPTAEERKTIEIIHRDMAATEEARLAKTRSTAETLLEDLESGQAYREDLDPEVVARLTQILRGSNGQ